MQKNQYAQRSKFSPDVAITEEDLRYLCEKCLTLHLYRHLDLSDAYTCADFLFFQDFRQQEHHMEYIVDFCLNHVAARDRSGVMRKSAQYALQFLRTPISSQQLRAHMGKEPDSPEERLGQLLMNPEFLTGSFDQDLWDPWEFFFFQALIDIDPKLPTRFFSALAQEQSHARFAKQTLADL